MPGKRGTTTMIKPWKMGLEIMQSSSQTLGCLWIVAKPNFFYFCIIFFIKAWKSLNIRTLCSAGVRKGLQSLHLMSHFSWTFLCVQYCLVFRAWFVRTWFVLFRVWFESFRLELLLSFGWIVWSRVRFVLLSVCFVL